MNKQVLYIDMDGVLVDVQSGFDKLDPSARKKYESRYHEVPGVFLLMEPIEGAVEAFHKLSQVFDTYILSGAPWNNPSAWCDKLLWVKRYLGDSPAVHKRLILTNHKNLNRGDFLIDDNKDKNGVEKFEGEHIHFGHGEFQSWNDVLRYLIDA